MINFKNINIVKENEIIKSSLSIKEGKINSIGQTSTQEGFDFEDNYYLIPGLIDQHIHGGYGVDVMDLDENSVNILASNLIKEGTTSFVATTMTMSKDRILNAIKNVNKAMLSKNHNGANILGVHMEGPYISKIYKGAQKDSDILDININDMVNFNKYNNVRIISSAPELNDSELLFDYCKNNNIIYSIGHTNATHSDCLKLINKGCKNYTHAFNAMSKLTHREINVVGSFLLQDYNKIEIICDNIHIDKECIKLVTKYKKNNIILITDSMRAKGLGNCISELGGQTVYVKDGQARLEDNTLAGSVLRLIDGVKNIYNDTNIKLYEAINMASKNPAINLNIFDKKGSIEVNKDADLCVIDKDFNVIMTIVGGKILYDKTKEISNKR